MQRKANLCAHEKILTVAEKSACHWRRFFAKESRKQGGENFLSEIVFVSIFAGVTNAAFVTF